MGRREIRETIFRLLFRVAFVGVDEMGEQTACFFADTEGQAALSDGDYIRDKLQNILDKLPELDDILAGQIEGWEIDRIGKVDLAILRLALFELLHDPDIPEGVAINEAVELAKKYGQDNSRAFVNGVLSKITRANAGTEIEDMQDGEPAPPEVVKSGL